MNTIKVLIETLHQVIWSWPVLLLFYTVGLYLSFTTNFIQFRSFFSSLKLIFKPKDKGQAAGQAAGQVSSFASIMTILAGTIGVGCISGVAICMKMSGPGSIFWMWVVCLLTMPLKYSEAFLANEFKEVNEEGQVKGGPMYYLKRGLNAPKLATCFAVCLVLASFGMGNCMQVSAVIHASECLFTIKPLTSALILMPIVFIIAHGGVRRIAKVLSYLVPIMMIFYIIALLIVIAKNYQNLPGAVGQIFSSAFNPKAVLSGTSLSLLIKSIQMGSAQALFTSESGLGSSSIASCTARGPSSHERGLLGMGCGFITTCIVCTLTALCYLCTNALDPALNLTGVNIAIHAFNTISSWFGYIVFACIIPFAFSTMLSWIYYGQKGVEFLFNLKSVKIYRLIYVVAILFSAFIKIDLVYLLSNILNALMSIPNLIGLIFLAPLLKKAQERQVLAEL